LKSSKAIARMVRKSSPDIVHVQYQFGLFGGPFGTQILPILVLARSLGAKVVVTVHSLLDWKCVLRHFLGAVRSRRHRILGYFARVFLLMYQMVAYHLVLYGIALLAHRVIVHTRRSKEMIPFCSKTVVIFHGTDTLGREYTTACRRIASLKLITMGFIHRNKGIHLAFEAIEDMLNVSYTVVGRVLSKTVEQQQYALSLAKGKPQNATIIDGYVDDCTLDQLIAESDAVILPYVNACEEGASGTFHRSLAHAKPVIASDFMEFADFREYCCLFKPGSVRELKQAIQWLMNPDVRKWFSTRSKELAERTSMIAASQMHLRLYAYVQR